MRKTAELFRALGDETRLRMLWLLLNHRSLCVCDFMQVLGISQSKASRHLRSLYHAGLVEDRREGQWNYYTLKDPPEGDGRAIVDLLRELMSTRAEGEALLSELEGWLERKQPAAPCG